MMRGRVDPARVLLAALAPPAARAAIWDVGVVRRGYSRRLRWPIRPMSPLVLLGQGFYVTHDRGAELGAPRVVSR